MTRGPARELAHGDRSIVRVGDSDENSAAFRAGEAVTYLGIVVVVGLLVYKYGWRRIFL